MNIRRKNFSARLLEATVPRLTEVLLLDQKAMMTSKEISKQLMSIVSSEDFANSSAELTEAWLAADVGMESIDPILKFMEAHNDLDYGTPGALVHFVENFYLSGYEAKLIKSVGRKPTTLTVWMLNRILNGTDDQAMKKLFTTTMKKAAVHPKVDQETLESVNGFLEQLESNKSAYISALLNLPNELKPL